MIRILIIPFLLLVFIANGQYYFTDIVANQLSDVQYKQLLANKVKQVKGVSYDKTGEVLKGFNIDQSIKNEGKKIVSRTEMPNTEPFLLINEHKDGRLFSSISSNVKSQTSVETITYYTYSSTGNISTINTHSRDTAVTQINSKELHIWEFNDKNVPLRMLKVKSDIDTTKVTFEYDEKGNVDLEKWYKANNLIETYYYYYNDANQLTDVVRFNSRLRKLLPDFIYEYDADNKITKMTQVIKGGTDYLIWRYGYNEKGLKESEKCYDKSGHLQGKVTYEYFY